MDPRQPTYSGREWPGGFESMCHILLHQQCWCWGQDVRRTEGNLLLDYGFQQCRPPANVQGGTRYQLRLSQRATVTLWGFGLYYARCGRGGVYVNRYDCTPRYCHQAGFLEGVWTREALPAACLAPHWHNHDGDTAYLAAKVLAWISAYEQWVLERYGNAYRRKVLREWHEPSILPERMPGEWLRLGQMVRLRPTMRDPHAA